MIGGNKDKLFYSWWRSRTMDTIQHGSKISMSIDGKDKKNLAKPIECYTNEDIKMDQKSAKKRWYLFVALV